MNKQILFSKPR